MTYYLKGFVVLLAVDAFSEERITANVLKQILKRKDVILDIKIKDAPKESLILYEKGKVVDYFMMVVQGHVDVTVGMEEFTFPQGEYLLCISCNCSKTSPIQTRQAINELEMQAKH